MLLLDSLKYTKRLNEVIIMKNFEEMKMKEIIEIDVEYGVFGKFRFMTQTAYDALGSYDEDTIYFVRDS